MAHMATRRLAVILQATGCLYRPLDDLRALLRATGI